MKTDNYTEYTKQLRDSTMFHMSLGSKELFHSNFLHWISTVNWSVFLDIMHKLADTELFWWENKYKPENNNIEVRREYHHFDLSIYILDHNADVEDSYSVDTSTDDNDTNEYSHDQSGKRIVQKWIPVLILENKMKSLPYKGQLIEYTNKAFNEWRTCTLIKEGIKKLKNQNTEPAELIIQHGITFILLSLMDTQIDQNETSYQFKQQLKYSKSNVDQFLCFPFCWKHKSYQFLNTLLPEGNILRKFSKKRLDRFVIKDYSIFLAALYNLANKCWIVNPYCSFRSQISPWIKKSEGNLNDSELKKKISEFEEYKKLRIHDIHEKLLYDQLLILLENKLGTSARYDSKTNEDHLNEGIKLFTKSDYAHGVGIFEAQYYLFKPNIPNLKEDYFKLIIQVQGERYCHMVICDNVAKGAKQVNENMIKSLSGTISHMWKQNLPYSIDQTLADYISIDGSIPNFPFNPKEYGWGKYGDNCVYQYVDIPFDATVDVVINAIAEDIDKIKNWYKQQVNLP